MPITVIGTAATRIASATTDWTGITIPAGAAGDVAIIATFTRNDHTVTAYPASSQTPITAQWDPGDPKITLWALPFTSTPPATVAVTMGAATAGTALVILLRGAATSSTIVESNAIDPDPNSTGTDGYSSSKAPNAPIPTLTTSVAGSIVLAAAVTHQADNLLTKPSGWADVAQLASAAQPGAILAVKGIQATPSAQAAENFTYTGTAAYGSALRLAVRPAAGTTDDGGWVLGCIAI